MRRLTRLVPAGAAVALMASGQTAQAASDTAAGSDAVVGIYLDLVMTVEGCEVQLTYDGPAEVVMTAWAVPQEDGTYDAVAHLGALGGHFSFVSRQDFNDLNEGWDAAPVDSPRNMTASTYGAACEWPEEDEEGEGNKAGVPEHAGVQGPPPHAGVPGPPPHARGKALGRN